MYLNTTEKITILPKDAWHIVVFNGNKNLTTGRNSNAVHYNDEINTRFQFQFLLNDSTIELVIMYICVVIFVLGIIGNIVTMAKIVCDSKYHTPTFAAIGNLALADFFSLNSTGFWYFTNILLVRDLSNYFIAVDNFFYLNSSGHMLLLSIVRYLITVHPLQSRQHLTVPAVSFCSLSVWVLSVVGGVGFSYSFMPLNFRFGIIISFNVTVLVLVCAITITLHVRKMKAINNSLSVTSTRQLQTRMNLVVTVIIMIFVLFHLFLITRITIFEYLKHHVHGYVIFNFLQQGMALTGFLNYSCNPYILFISHSIFAHLNSSRI